MGVVLTDETCLHNVVPFRQVLSYTDPPSHLVSIADVASTVHDCASSD
jgi:hypothetical protein